MVLFNQISRQKSRFFLKLLQWLSKVVLIGLKYCLKGLKWAILGQEADKKNFYKNRLYRYLFVGKWQLVKR
jgi:hypothetical protein